jgi:hypothetical protein
VSRAQHYPTEEGITLILTATLRRLRAWFLAPVLSPPVKPAQVPPSTSTQLLLELQYRQLRHVGAPLPRVHEVGFRVYSESDEDGILHYIFSLIGTRTRILVDLGACKLEGSNTANLLINHGWTGLLIDGDEQHIKDLQDLYGACRDTHHYPPKCVAAWITAENVNDLIRSAGIEGEIDLLAIDLDGVDYWILKEIEVVRPRVVVVEYQCILGPERCVSVPYRPDFKPIFDGPYAVYNSASLAAFVKLGRRKGYRLVGCQRYGYNAFFVRDDLASHELPEISPRVCFEHPFPRWAMATLYDKVRDKEWVEV